MAELTEFIKDDPQGTTAASQGKTDSLQGTTVSPQGTTVSSQGTMVSPQGTTVSPQRTTTSSKGPVSYAKGSLEAFSNSPLESFDKDGTVVQGTLLSSGSEGAIIRQPDNKILKVYQPGRSCNRKVLPLVKQLNGKGYAVELYDYGTMDYQGQRCDFELMQYCPLGPVSNRKNLKGDADAILKIAISTAMALDAFHKAGFIHKDVKPANILIENEKTWHCVLCDFGIADLVKDAAKETLQTRTPIYAAPEMYDSDNCLIKDGNTYCRLTPAADFYSLGMTILSLWWGESAFKAKEIDWAFTKKNNGVSLPDNMPEPLRTITQGLLVPDPDNRWGLAEIIDKYKGKDVKIHRGLKIEYNKQKNQIARSPEELALLMAQDLNLAQRYLYTDMVSDWLRPLPEMQVQIKEIVAENNKDKKELGLLKVLHTLNPSFDLNLYVPKKANDEQWGMTDQRIGELLNNAYYLYFVKYGRNYASMSRNWTADDSKLVHSPMVAYQLAHSFEVSNDKSYLPWFLATKMNGRFNDQLRWYKSCVNLSAEDKKKAGPKDSLYLAQRAMMRTIAGFNCQPTYRLINSNTVFRSLEDFHAASSRDLKDALANERGIRGWLAVMHHENPAVNLRPQYTYEKLLEQYVKDLGYCDSKNGNYQRFEYAQDQAKSISTDGKSDIRSLHVSNFLQKFLAIAGAFVPCLLLLICIILNLIDNPKIEVSLDKIKWVFWVIAGVAALIYYLAFGDGGLIGPAITGVVTFAVLFLLAKFLSTFIVWIYALVVLVAFVFLSFRTVFSFNKYTQHTRSVTNPGFEELVLEPLYFAFSNETTFDSSMSEGVDPVAIKTWRKEISSRWAWVLVFIVVTWGLASLSLLLPDSPRMSNFNRHWKRHALTERVIENINQPTETSML